MEACGSLEEEAQDHHVVNCALLAGLVGQHRHEGKQQAHQAVLQDEGAYGDLPMSHVGGAAVFQALDNNGSGRHGHLHANPPYDLHPSKRHPCIGSSIHVSTC